MLHWKHFCVWVNRISLWLTAKRRYGNQVAKLVGAVYIVAIFKLRWSNSNADGRPPMNSPLFHNAPLPRPIWNCYMITRLHGLVSRRCGLLLPMGIAKLGRILSTSRCMFLVCIQLVDDVILEILRSFRGLDGNQRFGRLHPKQKPSKDTYEWWFWDSPNPKQMVDPRGPAWPMEMNGERIRRICVSRHQCVVVNGLIHWKHFEVVLMLWILPNPRQSCIVTMPIPTSWGPRFWPTSRFPWVVYIHWWNLFALIFVLSSVAFVSECPRAKYLNLTVADLKLLVVALLFGSNSWCHLWAFCDFKKLKFCFNYVTLTFSGLFVSSVKSSYACI